MLTTPRRSCPAARELEAVDHLRLRHRGPHDIMFGVGLSKETSGCSERYYTFWSSRPLPRRRTPRYSNGWTSAASRTTASARRRAGKRPRFPTNSALRGWLRRPTRQRKRRPPAREERRGAAQGAVRPAARAARSAGAERAELAARCRWTGPTRSPARRSSSPTGAEGR